ncbi:putative RNA methyltransferase [Platanthera zijinensis]|uniref:RNA methyltransferase n=1 Tax=Platanthera zijinensis TaxID=2320716 RepID=A0AAP0AW41_9ASPA
MLQCYILDYKGAWDEHLPLVEFAYNNRYQESLRMTTFKALPRRSLTCAAIFFHIGENVVTTYMMDLKAFCHRETSHVYPRNMGDTKFQIVAERLQALCLRGSDTTVVVLDELGKEIGSHQLADLVGDAGGTGSSKIAFCIGGPYGLGPLVRNRADITIRLSLLVLNHQIALLVLLEQLYRALEIISPQEIFMVLRYFLSIGLTSSLTSVSY